MNALLTHLHPALFSLGTSELLLILVAVLIVFGPSNLPKLADAMGKAVKNFRKASSGEEVAGEKKEPEEKKDQN